MMLVNRLQRDLQSSNVLEASIALTAAAKLLTADMIPACMPLCLGLLKHDQELLRKKAVMLLHRFFQLSPESLLAASPATAMSEKLRRALCDKDPSVMGASLHLFHDLIARAAANPTAAATGGAAGGDLSALSSFKDLTSSFVSILKQITEHRLPREWDYHRIPAPWLQIRLLRILALLGKGDRAVSEGCYEVLLEAMRRSDTGINAGYAVLVECLRTASALYPSPALLDAAATAIGRFLASDNHNLRFLGVTGLAAIVERSPARAAEHQLAVIDCLTDPDETLKRRTLDLLFRMTNSVNVTVITQKLMESLSSLADPYLKAELVGRIVLAAERFAPSASWYASTMIKVFELGGSLVKPEVAQNLLRLLAEGTGDDSSGEEADNELRRGAVEGMLALLDKEGALPDLLLQVMFWSLGEYAFLCAAPAVPTGPSLATICDKICVLGQRAGLDTATRGYALSAALKLTAQMGGVLTPATSALLHKLATSQHVDLAQRCHEFLALSSRPSLMKGVLPVDASNEDIFISDSGDLPFLHGFVSAAEAAGARPYSKPAHLVQEENGGAFSSGGAAGGGSGLRFDAYDKPDPLASAANMAAAAAGILSGLPTVDGTGAGGANSLFPPPAGGAGGAAGGVDPLTGGGALDFSAVKGAWGKEGYKTAQGNVLGQAPPPAPAAAAAAASGLFAGLGGGSPYDAGALSSANANPAIFPGANPTAPPLAPPMAPAAPPAPVEPPKPRELTEKEKLAASLFGGIAASTTGGGPPAGSMFATPASAAASKPAAATATASGGLFGGLGGAAARPAGPWGAAPAPAPAPANDLLDLFGGPVAAAPKPAPAPAAAAMGGGLGDLFGAPAPAPAPKAAAGGLGDLFGSMSVGGSVGSGAGVNVSSLTVPMQLVDAIGGGAHKKEPASGQNIALGTATDGSGLAVAYHKVLAPDALHVVLFVAAASAASGVSLTLTGLPYVNVTSVKAFPPLAGAASPAPGNGVTLPLGNISAGQHSCVVLSAVLTSPPPAGQASGSMRVAVSRAGAMAPSVTGAVEVANTDVTRPVQGAMDTNAFGGLWTNPSMRGESVITIPAAAVPAHLRTLEGFMAALPRDLNLTPVQAIAATSEGIAAGRLLTPAGTPPVFILLHTRVNPGGSGGLELRCKTADLGMTQAMLAGFAAKLK